MSKPIPVSPRHGLNPGIPRCFFCGEPKNELVLFGRLKNDAEAPKSFIIDYEPCDACKERFKAGVLLIAAGDTPRYPSQPPLGDKYPTGAYSLVKPDLIRRLCEPEMADSIVKAGHSLIDPSLLENLLKQAAKTTEE